MASDTDLPDIVQDRAQADRSALLRGDLHRNRQSNSPIAYAPCVCLSVRIASLQSRDEGFNRLGVMHLQLRRQVDPRVGIGCKFRQHLDLSRIGRAERTIVGAIHLHRRNRLAVHGEAIEQQPGESELSQERTLRRLRTGIGNRYLETVSRREHPLRRGEVGELVDLAQRVEAGGRHDAGCHVPQ